MQEQLSWVVGKNGEDGLLSMQSDTEAYYGRFRKARDSSQRAVLLATQGGYSRGRSCLEGQRGASERPRLAMLPWRAA